MANVILKNASGEDVIYEDVATVTLNGEDGNPVIYSEGAALPIFSPVKVGQYLQISDVDEDGVITELEAVDTTASDWEIIKNKPFGDYGTIFTEIFPESTIPFNYSENNGGYILQITPPSEYLKTWYSDWTESEVVWDGTTYACQAQNIQGIKALGNIGLMMDGTDTGEPFIIAVADAATFGQDICRIYSLMDEIPEDPSTAETKYHDMSIGIY